MLLTHHPKNTAPKYTGHPARHTTHNMPQSRNKYYLRAPHAWTQLSPRLQAMLARFDAHATALAHIYHRFNAHPQTSLAHTSNTSIPCFATSIPHLRNTLASPARYEVVLPSHPHAPIEIRTIRFDNRDEAEVALDTTPPTPSEDDYYYYRHLL